MGHGRHKLTDTKFLKNLIDHKAKIKLLVSLLLNDLQYLLQLLYNLFMTFQADLLLAYNSKPSGQQTSLIIYRVTIEAKHDMQMIWYDDKDTDC